jgi:hypothetical protein
MYFLNNQLDYLMTYLTNTSKVDASYDGSLFTTLWTFYRMYSIQMSQTHCKIINFIKIFMD